MSRGKITAYISLKWEHKGELTSVCGDDLAASAANNAAAAPRTAFASSRCAKMAAAYCASDSPGTAVEYRY